MLKLSSSRITFIALLASVLVLMLITNAVNASISQRSDVRQFIDGMAKKHDFNRKKLIKIFKKVDINNKIIEAITRPAEGKPWYKYRPIFLTKTRINEGVKFWDKHANTLQRAYEKYGVPAEIVVAIIGVETRYGRYKGTYPVIESLSTLGFDYPKRGKFFRKELREFLLMAREEKLNPLKVKGSYAGAMGKPQFISSSFRRYAVDFDGDGKRDLWDNSIDTIGSVANYFKKHKWRKDKPITSKVSVKGKKIKALVKKGYKPHSTIATLSKKGVSIKSSMKKNIKSTEKAALIQLKLKKGNEHWLGLNNFYVITRYNHSELYAMAVYQLSQEILKKRNKALAKKQ